MRICAWESLVSLAPVLIAFCIFTMAAFKGRFLKAYPKVTREDGLRGSRPEWKVKWGLTLDPRA
jgi:hypothetical protein